jgi:16S rRNA G1207 methylase RsmC
LLLTSLLYAGVSLVSVTNSKIQLAHRLEAILSTHETIANDNKKVVFDAWVREKYKNRPLPY